MKHLFNSSLVFFLYNYEIQIIDGSYLESSIIDFIKSKIEKLNKNVTIFTYVAKKKKKKNLFLKKYLYMYQAVDTTEELNIKTL